VPGAAQQGPARPREGVALASIGAEPFHVDVPGPPVQLDRDPPCGKGEVDQIGPERVGEDPARDARIPQQPLDDPLRRRVRAVGGGGDQPGRSGPSSATEVAAVAGVQLGEGHVPLECPVEEGRAVAQGHRRLQRGERTIGEPQVPAAHEVGALQVAPPHDDAAGRHPVARAGHGDLDGHGGPIGHPVPVGRGRPGDRRRLAARPEPRGPHPRLVGAAVPVHEVDVRIQLLPRSAAHPPLHRPGAEPERHGLPAGDHPGLPLHRAVDGHRVRMRRTRRAAGPFHSDRQKWCGGDGAVASTPLATITRPRRQAARHMIVRSGPDATDLAP